jgi:hypothetical protein
MSLQEKIKNDTSTKHANTIDKPLTLTSKKENEMSENITKFGYAEINPLWKMLPIAALIIAMVALFLVCYVIGTTEGEKLKERRRQIDERIRHLEENENQTYKAVNKALDESPAQITITSIVHTERVFAPVAISFAFPEILFASRAVSRDCTDIEFADSAIEFASFALLSDSAPISDKIFAMVSTACTKASGVGISLFVSLCESEESLSCNSCFDSCGKHSCGICICGAGSCDIARMACRTGSNALCRSLDRWKTEAYELFTDSIAFVTASCMSPWNSASRFIASSLAFTGSSMWHLSTIRPLQL